MKSFHIICIIILVQLRSFGIHEHSQRRYIFLNILDTFPFAHDISYSVYYMVWNFIALRVIFCRHLSDAVIMQMVATCLYIFHKEGADAIRIKCSFYCMLKRYPHCLFRCAKTIFQKICIQQMHTNEAFMYWLDLVRLWL